MHDEPRTATPDAAASNRPVGEIAITVRDEDVLFSIKRHQFDITPVVFALPFVQLDEIFLERLRNSIAARRALAARGNMNVAGGAAGAVPPRAARG